MRYDDSDRESTNVEDRRNEPGGGGGFQGGGMGIPIPLGRGGMSITSLLIIGAVCLFLGINPLDLLRGGGIEVPQFPQIEPHGRTANRGIPGLPGERPVDRAEEDQMRHFVARVLADTEDVWTEIFKKLGRQYTDPKLVIFTGETRTACGTGERAMGPFYCPLDQKVYIDLAFYDELKRRFHAPGDFAQAYVIAHEVGHHVQTLIGISDKVQREKERNPSRANEMQVRMELQADCLAGVWGSVNDQLKHRLQPGDIEQALNAASAIGDDTLQRQAQGRVRPETFTHGTSAQRVAWFKRGFDSGQISACNTFGSAI